MRRLALIGVCVLLAACGRNTVPRDVDAPAVVPIVGVARTPALSLTMEGNVMADPSGSALVRLSGGSVICEGIFAPSGRGTLYCSNNVEIAVAIPREVYTNPNGSGVIAGPEGGRLALGWGRSADPAFVESLLTRGPLVRTPS